MPRIISPSGGSILMISAPRSPRIWVATGPNTATVRSMTRIPATGPDTPFPNIVLAFARSRRTNRHPGAGRESIVQPSRALIIGSRPSPGRRLSAIIVPSPSKGDRMIAPPDPDDLERVKAWFRRLSEHVQAVDFAGAHPLFAEDMIAFGTFENFITGREAVERAQWRNVWPVTSGFHFRMDDIRAIVSSDRLSAIGMGVFDSTGYHEDGTPYERPGSTTVALSRRRIGEDWVADHTHMSLFRDVPSRSFGKKPGG